jgi:PAS domain S-box-containing protein
MRGDMPAVEAEDTIAVAAAQLVAALHPTSGFGDGVSVASLRQELYAFPTAIYTTDAAGRITFFNAAAVEMWGCTPELGSSEFCGSWKLFWPDGTPLPHDECPMAMALKQQRPITGMEAIAERPDGTRVLFLAHPTPLFDDTGLLIGAVNMLLDVSERASQRLASIVESSDDAIISKDTSGIIKTWNRGAERVFGYTAEEAIGQPVTMLIPVERLDEEPEILQRILRGERIDHYETIRKRKDGELIDISITVSPLRNATGRVVGASKIARDITERKRAEAHREMLLGEMKHRVKNTLAMVQAFANQTLRSVSKEEREKFGGRLRALAGAYELLTSETWNRAEMRRVVEQALEPFPVQRIVVEGPDCAVNATNASHLTLGLHELATNAVKYGALSNAEGRVQIDWLPEGQSHVRLTWREIGGPAVPPPERKGFGSTLIELVLENVQLEYAPSGVVCVMSVPVDK